MKKKEFLAECSSGYFPEEFGPWVGFEDFDPPFSLNELRQMARAEIIELEVSNRRFRLTQKATKMRDGK